MPELKGGFTDDADAKPAEESTLFEPEAPEAQTDDPGEGEPSAAEAEAGLFDEKPVSQKAFQKRLGKLIEQREAAREEAREARVAREAAQRNFAELEAFKARFEDRYGNFEDPAAQLQWDTQFLAAAESLAEGNPGVREAVQQIVKHMGGKPMAEKKTESKPAAPAEEAPKVDPAVAKIIERDARRTVQAALKDADVKPAFAKIITDHVIAHAEDLSDLDSAAAFEAARAFVKDSGFTPDEILANPPKPAKKPRTGGAAKAATGTPRRAADKGEDSAPEAPKTLDEWQKRRAERLASFGDE